MTGRWDPSDGGGILRPGVTVAVNTTGQPEPVLRPVEADGGDS